MRWFLIALIAVSATAVADAYVAIPWNDSKALYFPTVDTVLCYSVVVESEPTVVNTDRYIRSVIGNPAVVVHFDLRDQIVSHLLYP